MFRYNYELKSFASLTGTRWRVPFSLGVETMEKHSETDSALRSQRNDHLNRRWGQLYELEKDWSERALRYLLLTNSGGAIATLSFLGASEQARSMSAVIATLIFFIVGVFLVGISTAKTFHHMSTLFKKYQEESSRYFKDEISWDKWSVPELVDR